MKPLDRPCAPAIPKSLRTEWRLWGVGGVLTVGLALLFLIYHRFISSSIVGALSAAAALFYVIGVYQCGLKGNHPVTEQSILPGLGAANRLTFVRGLLICILAGFLGGMPENFFDPASAGAWLPGLLYLAAGVLDGLDGMMARVTRCETRMGSELDTKMDALGMLVAIGVAIRIGQLPMFYLTVAAAYYIFKAATILRKQLHKPVLPLLPRPAARAMAGMTMGLVGIALLPIYSAPATTVAAGLFMLPFCYGFLRDWLVVCEAVRSDAHQQAAWEPHLKNFFSGWMPPVVRCLIAFTAPVLLIQGINPEGLQGRLDCFQGLWLDHLLMAGLILLVVMVAAGFLGRLASLGLVLILGCLLQRPGIGPDGLALYTCAVILLLSGTGFYSLWQPEDRLLYRKRSVGKSF